MLLGTLYGRVQISLNRGYTFGPWGQSLRVWGFRVLGFRALGKTGFGALGSRALGVWGFRVLRRGLGFWIFGVYGSGA